MKWRNLLLLSSSILLLALLLPGCNQLSSSGSIPTVPSNERQAASAQTIINELEENLDTKALFLTAAQIQDIIDGAITAIVNDPDAELSSTDIYDVIPLITEGAIAGMIDPALFADDAFRIMVMEMILTSLTSSLDGREVQSPTFIRALDPNADVMRAILAGISAAAIRGLDTAGVTDANMAGAAGSVVETLVDNMDDAGVTGGYVGEAAGDLVSTAVAALAESIGDQAALETAVELVTGTAVSSLAEVDIDGFEDNDFPEAVGAIAEAVTSAAGTNLDIIDDAMVGIASAASGITSDPVILADIVEETAVGATEGLAANTDLDVFDDLDAVADGMNSAFGAIDLSGAGTTVETLIVVGASEGAANVTEDDSTVAADLTTAFGDSVITPVADDINDGIAQSENIPPVIAAISDRSVAAGNELTLSVSASDQDPSDTLTYAWFINDEPATYGAFVGATDNSQVIFKAEDNVDSVGPYVLRIEVSDGKETVYAFVNITVTLPTSMAARAMIDLGKTHVEGVLERDYQAGLDIFNQVEEGGDAAIAAEADFWQGYCLDFLEQYDNARSRYNSAVANADAAGNTAYEWKVRATNRLARLTAWQDGNLALALSMAQAIVDNVVTDGYWIADAYENIASFEMDLGNQSLALAANAEVANHSPRPRNTLWADFHEAQIEWRFGDTSLASVMFVALARALCDPGDQSMDAKFTGLDVSEKRDGVRWSYACAGWSLNEYGGPVASTIADYYDEAIAYPDAEDWWAAWYNREKAWRYDQEMDRGDALNDEANRLAIEAAFIAGKNAGSNEFSDDCRLRLGWLYQNWDGHEAEAVLAFQDAYDNSQDIGVKIDAGVSWAEYKMWHEDDNDACIAILSDVLLMDTSSDPVLEAKALLRMGHAWMRKGWDADDGVGDDEIGYFLTAIGYLDDITLSRYPELEPDDTWIYYEAVGDRAEALARVGQNSQAISLIDGIINSPAIAGTENKERLQKTKGDIYFDQGLDASEDGNESAALSMFDTAITEYGKVQFIEEGYWKADAILRTGQAYREKGWIYNNDNWSGYSEVNKDQAFSDAIDLLLMIDHDDIVAPGNYDFSGLVDRNDWIFFEAKQTLIEAYSERNEAGDIALVEAIVADIVYVPGYEPERGLEIMNDLARAYATIAENHPWGTYDATILDDYNTAISMLDNVITESSLQGHPNDGEVAADCWNHVSRLRQDLFRRYFDEYQLNDATYSQYFTEAESALQSSVAFQAGNYPEGGRDAAESQVMLADLYNDAANYLRHWDNDVTSNNPTNPAAVVTYVNYLEDSRAGYELFISNIEDDTWIADEWAWSSALQQLPNVLTNLVNVSVTGGGSSTAITITDVEDYINRIYNIVLVASISPDMERDRMGQLYWNMGNWLVHAGSYMDENGFVMDIQIDGSAAIVDATIEHHYAFAKLYLDQVIDNYSDIPDMIGEVYYYRGLMYRFWGNYFHNDANYMDAKTKYEEAINSDNLGHSSTLEPSGWWLDDRNIQVSDINDILLTAEYQ